MDTIRTTRIRIGLDKGIALETVSAWNALCNWLSHMAFENGCIANPVRLQRLCYTEARTRFGLSAQVTINAIRVVTSKYAGMKKKKLTPHTPVHFRDGSAVLLQGGSRGRDFSFTKHGLSIWTMQGRVKSVTFTGEPKLAEYIDRWALGDARLFVRKGKVYIAVSFKSTVPDPGLPGNVVGVDRGIRYIAVVTNGTRQLFFGGGHVNHVRDRHLKIHASLQSRKAQANTRSIRRVLQRLSGRERRFMTDVNHVISRRIADFAPNSIIAMEDLKGIRNRKLRKRQRGRLHRWAFFQLEGFIAYKAQSVGSVVLSVDAAYTSQACSKCGHTERANRSALLFSCKACGYCLQSDLNGSRNIRLRGILGRQVPPEDGAPSISP